MRQPLILLRLLCWWRGWHVSPPGYGWLFACGGFEVPCSVCGLAVRVKDGLEPHPEAKRQ